MGRFKWRHQYDDDRDAEEREKTDIETGGASLTQQQYTDDVNINVMMARMGVTDHALPPAAFDPKFYGDFSEVVDLRDIFDRTRAAETMFRELPAPLRARFHNDPAELLAFALDDANIDEAVRLGIIKEEVPKTPLTPNPGTVSTST